MCPRLLCLSGAKGKLLFLWLFCLGCFSWLQGTASADLLYLKSGSVIDIGWDYYTSQERLMIQRKEGTIAVPLSDVDRVEKTPRVSAPSSPGGQEVSQPQPEAEPRSGDQEAGREVLRRVAQEALDFLERLGPSEEPGEEARVQGQELCEAWIQDARSALQLEGGPQEGLREAGEDLVRLLGELQRDLESGRLDTGRDLGGTLREILDRL